MTRRALAALILWAGAAWGQGSAIRGDHLAVDQQNHWQAWNFAAGTVEISPQGTVQPHFVARNTNAVEDIVRHLKRNPPGNKSADAISILDAVLAGTNAAGVPNILDGDENTYWEPEADRPLRDWWFQVDLGRIVSARRIVLKFVAAGAGDPFLQFAVLTSDGALTSAKDVKYNVVFRTLKDNKDGRHFEVELTPTRPNDDPVLVNDMIRFVQVIVSESDSTRAAQVAEAEYAGLDPVDQGAVDYFKKVADGQIKVSQTTYEGLDPQARGSRRNYRRERPRLAELEVWTEGENIALGLSERKGVAIDFRGNSARVLVDGQFDTFLNMSTTRDGTVRTLFFDLRGFYWIDTHHTYYSPERRRFGNYDLQTSDGTRAPDGSLVWQVQSSVRNRITLRYRESYDADLFAPVKARFVQFSFWEPPNRFSSAIPREVQFYGEGFQPEVELTSPLIRLGTEQNLVSIEWDGEAPPGTAVEIQTRTGNQLAEEFRYFDSGGTEVTAEAYEGLGFFQKGEIDTLEVAGADWSNWSAPYRASGAAITSPSPRQFLMLRARLLSDDPLQAATLDAIRLNFVAPLARQFLGEIEPGVVEALAAEQILSLFVKPVGQTQAFDQVLLRVPAGMDLRFEQLRLGREAQWTSGEIAATGQVQVVPTGADSLWLRLDQAVDPGDAELLEVRFATTLFTPGVRFQASVGHSARGNSWQRVDEPGDVDATELAASQSLVLVGPIEGKRVLSRIEVVPPVITPNGDGINDQMNFSFSVSKLSGPQSVKVRIFDLSGRMVRHWTEERPEVSGAYALTWAGEDLAGKTLAPGVYLLEIGVDTDSNSSVTRTVVHRVFHVAY